MIRLLTNVEKEIIRNMPFEDKQLRHLINSQLSGDIEITERADSSILLFCKNRKHKLISEFVTNDADGVPVNIMLFVDGNNQLIMLEFLKCNKNNLIDLNICLENYLNMSEEEKISRLPKLVI